MSQTRFVNFGDTVLAQRINEISTAIVVPSVLEGADMSVGLGGKSVDLSPHKVMLNELLLVEDAVLNVFIPTPPATTLPMDATDYTIVYEHTNQQVQGGVPALLVVKEGIVGFDDLPNTVVIGWVRWPGNGAELQATQLVEAPKLQITNPSVFPTDVKIPPFVPLVTVDVPASTVNCAGPNCPVDVVYTTSALEANGAVPLIFTRSESPTVGAISQGDVFNPSTLESYLSLENTSPAINTIEHLFPFVAGATPPSRILLEANVEIGAVVTVALLDTEQNLYPAEGSTGTLTNTSSLFEFIEVPILNVDATFFPPNRQYFVSVTTQLNPTKKAFISLVGASANFLPL
jgi:hypothetical protein